MPLSQFDETVPMNVGQQIQNSDGTAEFTILGKGEQSRRVDRMLATSSDTIDHLITLRFSTNSGPGGILGSFTLPALQGTDGSGPLDCFVAMGMSDPSLTLMRGEQLSVLMDVDITIDLSVYIFLLGGLV